MAVSPRHVPVALFLATAAFAHESVLGPARRIRGSRLFPGGVAIADVNLDGIADVVVGNGLFLDEGRGPASAYLLDRSFALHREERLPAVRHEGLVSHPVVVAGDLDADTLPDLVSISSAGHVVVHRHRGSTADVQRHARFETSSDMPMLQVMRGRGPGAVLQVRGIAAVDLNRDVRSELVLCADVIAASGVVASTGLLVLRDLGTERRPSTELVLPGRWDDLGVADHDGDGALDLAVLRGGDLAVARNSRSGWRTRTWKLARPKRPTRLATGDLNGDGRADFVVAGAATEAAVLIYLADSLGAPGRAISVALPMRGHSIEALAVADMTSDGRKDLVLLVTAEQEVCKVVYYRSNRSGTWTDPAIITTEARIRPEAARSQPRFFEVADLDGDRNPELIIAAPPGSAKPVQLVLPNRSHPRSGVSRFGDATPGTGGWAPTITAAGVPALGNTAFAIRLADAPGAGARAVLWMSARRETRQMLGLTTHVFPFVTRWLSTRGPAGVGNGWAAVSIPIPRLRVLAERRLYFQWLAVDRGAANRFGLCATAGLEVAIGA